METKDLPPLDEAQRSGEILFLGDLQLGRQVDRMLTADKEQLKVIWGDMLPNLLCPPDAQNRLICANLECAVTRSSDPDQALEKRDVYFRLDPGNISVLAEGHIDFVSLANDHTRDFRTAGLRDTMAHLDALNIKYAGAGRKSKAGSGTVMKKGGLAYGFMAFTDHPREWAAFDKVYGINYINSRACNVQEVCASIAAFKESSGVDIMVVTMHWGNVWADGNPPEHIQDLFHAMIDSGVDIVHGHGSHNFRGVEAYKSKIIIYGAGTCLDDYHPDEDKRNDLSCAFLVTIENGSIKHMDIHAIKITQRDEASSTTGRRPQVCMASSHDRDRVISRMSRYSKALNTPVYRNHKTLLLPIQVDQGLDRTSSLVRRLSNNIVASMPQHSASRITAHLRSLTTSPGHRRSSSTPSAWQTGNSVPECDVQPDSQANLFNSDATPKMTKSGRWSLVSMGLPGYARKMVKSVSTPPIDEAKRASSRSSEYRIPANY